MILIFHWYPFRSFYYSNIQPIYNSNIFSVAIMQGIEQRRSEKEEQAIAQQHMQEAEAQRLHEQEESLKRQREEEIEAEANKRVAAMLQNVHIPLQQLKTAEKVFPHSKPVSQLPPKPVKFVKEGTKVSTVITRPTHTATSSTTQVTKTPQVTKTTRSTTPKPSNPPGDNQPMEELDALPQGKINLVVFLQMFDNSSTFQCFNQFYLYIFTGQVPAQSNTSHVH